MSDYSEIVSKMLSASRLVSEDAKGNEFSYITRSVEKLYRWFIQCDQGRDLKDGYVECLRVVRIKRGLPKYLLQTINSIETEDAGEFSRLFLSGLYMVVGATHFSKEFVDKNMRKLIRKDYYLYTIPEDLKDRYEESTLRINLDGSAVCLKRSNLTDWIQSSSHYQMLEL